MAQRQPEWEIPRRRPATWEEAALLADATLVHPLKKRKTALLLCLFFGWLGMHRFYVGKRRSGRLYLLTSGWFLVGVVVDLILILGDSFDDAYGRPLE